MDIYTIAVLIFCGMFSNVMSAIFGIGGGVLMVPILMTVFTDFPIQMVAATSLSIVIGTALINLAYFIRQKIKVSLLSTLLWSLGMIVGVQLGFYASFYMHENIIVGVFVATMLILSVKTFIASKKPAKESISAVGVRDLTVGSLFTTGGGFIAGLTGIGGGSIMAPLIKQLPCVHPSQVAIYSNYMMVLGGIGSMYGYLIKECPYIMVNTYQIGYINFTIIGIVVLSSFVTSFFSMKLRKILSKRVTDLALGFILLFIGIYTTVLKFVL